MFNLPCTPFLYIQSYKKVHPAYGSIGLPSLSKMISDYLFSKGELFKFPESSEGVQWFPSYSHIQAEYARLFQQLYALNPEIKGFFVKVTRFNSSQKTTQRLSRKYQKTFEEILRINCKICSNLIIYGKGGPRKGYELIMINYYHLHTNDPWKYVLHLKLTSHFNYSLKLLLIQSQQNQQAAGHFPSLQHSPTHRDTARSGSFRELLKKLDQKHLEYRFIPADILQEEAVSIDSLEWSLDKRDAANPHLPNILLIVSPKMKELYGRFGTLIGFDLTFGLITQKTSTDSQYMMGVFASTNLYKRIIVFGLVVTNTRSRLAYAYIFQEFFKMMGKQPEVIITDEEQAIYSGLNELKRRGDFKGTHLLDMFHILKKFRECSTKTETFQLIRKMIHAKNKVEYRKWLKVAMRGLANDKELKTLRSFDLNSDKYAFSQVEGKYVGLSVSNSINEFYHYLIKTEIPLSTHYEQAVERSLEFIDKKNFVSQFPYNEKDFVQNMRNSFLDQLNQMVSDKALHFLLKESNKGPLFRLLSPQQSDLHNFRHPHPAPLNCDRLYLQHQGKYFLICRTEGGEPKWRCLCEFEEKAGFFCCHLFKVLTTLNCSLVPYVSLRWKMIPQDLGRIEQMKEVLILKMNKREENRLLDPLNYRNSGEKANLEVVQ